MPSINTDLTPRIYVASLSDYNAGRLHGEWIDCAGKDADDIQAEIQTMLAASPEESAEEYAIHDYEGFGMLAISENEGIARVAVYTALIEDHGEAITAYLWYFQPDLDEAAAKFEDAYCGQHESFRDFSDALFDELYLSDIPEHVWAYLDYAAFARDLEINDYTAIQASSGGSVYIYSNHA